MSNYNKAILMGRLVSDVELRHLPSGAEVASLSIAVNEKWKNKQTGEWDDRASFFDLEAFGKTAANLNQYFSKGKPILVEAKARQDTWEDKQSGQKRSKVKFVIDRFEFVGGKQGDSQPSSESSPAPAAGSQIDMADVPF